MTLFWGLGLLLIGAWFGNMLADIRWQLNSINLDLIKIGKRQFKVVKPDNELSWDMLNPYKENDNERQNL